MILCCGEALIDMIPMTSAEGAEGFCPLAGGAVFNTAIALGRLGHRAGFLSGISTDRFGAQLCTALTESHVDTGLLIRSDRPTTMAYVTLTNGHASYLFYDENSAGRMIAPADLPAIPADITTLFFGGISLAVEPCADTYAALLAREGATRVVMIDPNIRAGFIRDQARYRDRLAAMLARADIVKVSDEDLDWLIDGDQGYADKAAQLRAMGPEIVIVTRGGDGAYAQTAKAEVSVPAPRITVADTVGAGDTFNAGFLAALQNAALLDKARLRDLTEAELTRALGFAARVAAVTCTRAGANPPWAADL